MSMIHELARTGRSTCNGASRPYAWMLVADGLSAGLGVGSVHSLGRLAGLHAIDVELPCRGLGFAGKHPGRLTSGADGHVLIGDRTGYVHTEDAWCQRANRLGFRASANQQDALDLCTQGTNDLQTVALGAQ